MDPGLIDRSIKVQEPFLDGARVRERKQHSLSLMLDDSGYLEVYY
jgi:hypothetical protein